MSGQDSARTSTATPSPVDEGKIPFIVGGETFETYYKVFGTLEGRTKRPVIVLHGGPGFSHDYMIPFGDLAAHDRPVILYDRLGSGRSTTLPHKPKEFWTVDLLIDEIFNLADHFGVLDDVDVIGHAWGAILLGEVIFRRQPPGFKHAVFSNSIPRMSLYNQSRRAQTKALPEWIGQTLSQGFKNTPECRKAVYAFSAVHQCRLDPPPAEYMKSLDYGFNNLYVNEAFREEFSDYDCVDRLHEIKVPTLIINGRYDSCADDAMADFLKYLPRAKWVKFESEQSSHTPMWEDRERYMTILNEFFEC